MKSILLAALLVSGAVHAQSDVAVVISRTPRYITVNQQQCSVQEVVSNRHSNEGKYIGGLAGAALGSTLGGNSRDNLAGGVIGALVGGAIGNEVSRGPDVVEQRQVCRYVPVTVQQGETVTFQYQGRTFSQVIQ